MIGIPLGILYSNVLEVIFHKYILHGRGRKPKSFWSFHWLEHHRAARKNEFRDAGYERPFFGWHAQTREKLALAFGAVVHAPLLPIAPFFAGTVMAYGAAYYYVHKKSHLNPEWAKKWLPWHYDHHMAPNQDCNWGVLLPIVDHLIGTRVQFLNKDAQTAHAASAAAVA